MVLDANGSGEQSQDGSSLTVDVVANGNRYDVVVVGAGLAGLYMLHAVRKLGLSAKLIEAGDGVGGTWYWNRYPGARVDVESIDYCYGFSEELLSEWRWTEKFATQPEVLSYLEFVARRLELLRDISFSRRVAAAHFVDSAARWHIATDHGDVYSAKYYIMATGALSLSYVPPFAGLDTFTGPWYHTGRWPHDGVDFAGKRVAVIGTGSSGIQAIPKIAETAEHVTVLQRTANFSLPAQNRPLGEESVQHDVARHIAWKQEGRRSFMGAVVTPPRFGPSAKAADPEELERELELRWQHGGTCLLAAYGDTLYDAESNDLVSDFIRRKIYGIVEDPAVAALLAPSDHPVGTKRICVDTDYYATYNRPNVTLVDVSAAPITGLSETGVMTTAGDYDVDVVVFATGYDAMSGPLLNVDIRGRDGVRLRDAWDSGPAMYLGLAVAGFPNMFGISGPGSPSVRANMATAIEHHVEWITDCLAFMEKSDLQTIEADTEAQAKWVAHVAELADRSLFGSVASWYDGGNIVGKPRVFMPYLGGFDAYSDRCEEVANGPYKGFHMESAADSDDSQAQAAAR
jgi:cyclohexanone monooxygenase